MYDLDAFSPGEIFKLNFKDVVESREFMCRCVCGGGMFVTAVKKQEPRISAWA